MRTPKNLVPMALGLLALAVATTGTAVAATGQIVNIADGTTASHVAKVDSLGRLSTTVAGTVSSRPAAPATPFRATGNVYDQDTQEYNTVVPATTATIAIDHLVIASFAGSDARRTMTVYYASVGIGQACDGAHISSFSTLATYQVGPQLNVVDDLTTPWVLKPTAGSAGCLVVNSYARPATDSFFSYMSVSGYIISGTPPAGTSAALRTGAKTSGGQQP